MRTVVLRSMYGAIKKLGAVLVGLINKTMKKYIINFKINGDEGEGVSIRDIPTSLGKEIKCEYADMQVTDGYHTMDELYDHRISLFVNFCRIYAHYVAASVFNTDQGRIHDVWRSKLHSDGTKYDGWFVMGINKEKGKQISYHLPVSEWSRTEFAETLDRAPEWDGHTPADVIERLKKI